MDDTGEGNWPPRKDDHAHLAPLAPSNRSKRRATRACDRCKHKKMRCTGKQPCLNCTNAGVQPECSYTAKYTRGKAPPIQTATYKSASTPGATWRGQLASSKRHQSSEHSFGESSSEPARSPSREIPKAQEESTNFASIYRRTQHNLSHTAIKKYQNPVHAFGDPPLPEPNMPFFILPPLEEARGLIDKFFEVIAPNLRILHQPTINMWLLEIFRSFGSGQHVDKARSAIILFLFAASYNFRDTSSDEEDTNISFRYFQAADDLLQGEKGEIRLESVQARLLQCFYLLARSRFNHAWSVFGTAVSQIFVLELYRKTKSDRAGKEDLIYAECCKRTFWGAYTLDKFLSLSLGRPQYFHEDTIDQDIPLLVNDENLSKTSCIVTNDELQCTMRSSLYQKRQTLILAAILNDLYGIRPQSLETRLSLARKHYISIKLLARSESDFLEQDISNMRTLLRQQLFGAKISHAHLIIILFRPFLLDDAEDEDEVSALIRNECESNVSACLEAAMDITQYVESSFNVRQFFNGSWYTHFCGYTAAVALYVYVIKHQNDPEGSWVAYFKAAEKCQTQIKVAAEKDSFSQKCSQVLDELHAEVMNQIVGRKRQQERRNSFRGQPPSENTRSQAPQYLEQFAIPLADAAVRQNIPEFTYGEDWQNMNFVGARFLFSRLVLMAKDQTAPGGGILGSMDWIHAQSPNSVVDQIERWGFSSLTV